MKPNKSKRKVTINKDGGSIIYHNHFDKNWKPKDNKIKPMLPNDMKNNNSNRSKDMKTNDSNDEIKQLHEIIEGISNYPVKEEYYIELLKYIKISKDQARKEEKNRIIKILKTAVKKDIWDLDIIECDWKGLLKDLNKLEEKKDE